MKGYIYLLKEKCHKTTYKFGRTNNIKNRLFYYNNGKTKIPHELLQDEGDISQVLIFKDLPDFDKYRIIKANPNFNYTDKSRIIWQNRSPTEYEFEYIHKIKVKDCIYAENWLKTYIHGFDTDRGEEPEWIHLDEVDWVIEGMQEVADYLKGKIF